MPAPQASMFAQLTKVLFVAKDVNLPSDWGEMGSQYPDAFSLSELITAPNQPMNLFLESTLNKYHVDAAKDIGEKFEKYIDGICKAICSAIDTWMKIVKFTSIQVMAVCAIGAPGCMSGPGLKPFILSTAPMKTEQEQKYSKAIASAFDGAWKSWQDKITVPGLPWYPAFAAFPGPMAPPMPNIPMPLIVLPSAGEVELKKAMEDNLGDKEAMHASELFDSLAKAFAVVFLLFKSTTVVTNVMGKGPIPTFAPPFVPVGPVVGGDVLPIPCILT
jgi:hypothetical protein